MPNKIKLENPLQPVHLTLADGPTIIQGDGADKNYVHIQQVASSAWTITHNLNKYCSVTVVDTDNNVVIGDIIYTNINSLQINFADAFSGKAYLN